MSKMPTYSVLIEGQGFTVLMDGDYKPIGFYTTRIVEACDEITAGEYALQKITQEEKYKALLKESKTTGAVRVEEIVRREQDFQFQSDPGYAFYVDE